MRRIGRDDKNAIAHGAVLTRSFPPSFDPVALRYLGVIEQRINLIIHKFADVDEARTNARLEQISGVSTEGSKRQYKSKARSAYHGGGPSAPKEETYMEIPVPEIPQDEWRPEDLMGSGFGEETDKGFTERPITQDELRKKASSSAERAHRNESLVSCSAAHSCPAQLRRATDDASCILLRAARGGSAQTSGGRGVE